MREVWVSTDVATEPVSSAEAKLFAKIPSTADDTVVTYLIKAAREQVEQFTGCSLASKTLIAEWDSLPDDGIIELPMGPVSSISQVAVFDEEGEIDTSIDYYDIATIWKKLRILDILATNSRLRVTYVAGYGASTCPALPSDLKTCILKEIATQYQFRENITEPGAMQNEWQKKAARYRRGI